MLCINSQDLTTEPTKKITKETGYGKKKVEGKGFQDMDLGEFKS